MAKPKKKSTPTKKSTTKSTKPVARKKKPVAISAADLRKLPKAPGDYEETVRKLADVIESTKFRGPVSANKLRSLVSRGEKLTTKADAAEQKFLVADRARIAAQSEAWKSTLSNWRMIVASMPDRPELEDAFAFMTQYMSAPRAAPEAAEPAAKP